ncbi:hypothetical protein HUG10_17930 [Halorarum halophilum]|uniref:Uncharacterized protein n=1 Tax=Halorarum halophilum TaxID=2743090 RepID=A0A7D5K9Q0_9EURY|nr:hypothetical protein [Halobaculum halophilum]QLG29294.1 hypothetical protein HUG10_17930 [Halobaculum halophilum]
MERRGFLSGLVATTGLGVTAGCLGAGGGGGDGGGDTDTPTDAPTDTRSETPSEDPDGTPSGTGTPDDTTGTPGSSPVLSDSAFETTGDCAAEEAGTAGISFGSDAVTCTGCITGKNGCQQATLANAEYDAGDDLLTIEVTTTAGGDTPESCTQQIVHRGYESTFTFEGGLPTEVSVVHESMGEQSEAAHATRE